jgi:pimeloyl-ACP methyl ester carboxylesterase
MREQQAHSTDAGSVDAADEDAFAFLSLPGRRRLAYAEYGDPEGRPVLYCHGFPSSRREALLLDGAARAQRARIIAPDRTGYGDSDTLSERNIGDWPADAAALMDHLGIERVAVLGVSGGGPYALACASLIPGRLAACTLVCPLGPIYLDAVLGEMRWAPRLNLSLAHRAPWLAEWVFNRATTEILARMPETVDQFRTLTAPPADRDVLTDPETRRILNRTIQDAMRGGAHGARRDLYLYTHPWGIDLAAVSLPVRIWHGEADGTVPATHAHWYAQNLQRATLECIPAEGHYSLPLRYATNILAALLGESGIAPATAVDAATGAP